MEDITISASSSSSNLEMNLLRESENESHIQLGKKGFIWSHNPHPMCIPHIVDTILSYLNVPGLKSCRLVNSQYNEIACHNLARKEVIIFNKMVNLSSYISFMPISSTIHSGFDIKSIVTDAISATELSNDSADNKEEFISSSNYPDESHYSKNYAHSSYHFNFDPNCNNDPNNDHDILDTKILLEFFSTIGPHIKSLHYTTDLIPLNFAKRMPHFGDIWKNRLNNLETLSFEMKWGIPSVLFEKEEGQVKLPSVKKLILDILVTEREADRAAIFLRQLLQATPNVEEISIPGNKKFFDDYINVVLGRIILSLQLPRLTTLNFCLALNEPQIRALAEKNFPLKSLILDFADVQNFSIPQVQPIIPLPNPNDENNNNNNIINHPQNLFFLQNQLLNRSLHTFFLQIAPTLQNLHLCFPYNPSHPLHRFTFPVPMIQLRHLALGGFYGSVTILNHIPAIRKLDLWNVRFHDFDYDGSEGKQFVPHEYFSITTVIS